MERVPDPTVASATSPAGPARGVGTAATTASRFTLITGANSGIGLELAREAAADRHDLILVARNAESLEAAAHELGRSITVHTIAEDLSQPGAAQRVWDRVQSLGAEVDCLINDAGFGDHGSFAESDLVRQERMIGVNVTALTALTRLFLPPMLQRGRGRVLNLASVTGFLPGPLMSVYFATKHYVLAFSEALNEELRGSGVSVTALCPPPVRTDFSRAAQVGLGELHGDHAHDAGGSGAVRVSDDAARKSRGGVQPALQVRDGFPRPNNPTLRPAPPDAPIERVGITPGLSEKRESCAVDLFPTDMTTGLLLRAAMGLEFPGLGRGLSRLPLASDPRAAAARRRTAHPLASRISLRRRHLSGSGHRRAFAPPGLGRTGRLWRSRRDDPGLARSRARASSRLTRRVVGLQPVGNGGPPLRVLPGPRRRARCSGRLAGRRFLDRDASCAPAALHARRPVRATDEARHEPMTLAWARRKAAEVGERMKRTTILAPALLLMLCPAVAQTTTDHGTARGQRPGAHADRSAPGRNVASLPQDRTLGGHDSHRTQRRAAQGRHRQRPDDYPERPWRLLDRSRVPLEGSER